MGGSSSSTQNTSQTSQLTPYAPVTGGLNNLISGLNPSIANLNGGQQVQDSLSRLYNSAQQPNPLGASSINAANSQLGGAANYGQSNGILTNAYNNTANSLNPYTSGSAMDPSSNPALAQQLANVNTQVQNTVAPTFAAAGRFASPAMAQSMARGIAQGDTGILQNAASNQLNAIGQLQGAAGNTASGLTSNDLANAGILGQGINNASTAYGNQTLPQQLALQTSLLGNQLPIQNASSLAGILGNLGGMFGTQTGTGTSTGTQQMSGAQQFATIMGGIGSLGNLWGGGKK